MSYYKQLNATPMVKLVSTHKREQHTLSGEILFQEK